MSSTDNAHETASGPAGAAATPEALPPLRLFRPNHPAAALGLAVNYLMTKPAFANLRFGDWSRILVGQINRGHYCFAVDPSSNVIGFIGWALTSKDNAEGWVEGTRPLAYEDSKEGDCVVFNAWSANNSKVHRFLLDAARRVVRGKDTIYFKRHYKDGSMRPVRLSANDFVGTHIDTKAALESGTPASATP